MHYHHHHHHHWSKKKMRMTMTRWITGCQLDCQQDLGISMEPLQECPAVKLESEVHHQRLPLTVGVEEASPIHLLLVLLATAA
jgi:hypothetical protein